MWKQQFYANRFVVIATAASAALWSNHGQADALPSRYTIANGIVYDTRTNLSWEQAVSSTMYSLSDASARCAMLNLDGNGWRLPSMKELQTIVDEKRYNPAIDPPIFPGTPVGTFWTSSSNPVAGLYLVNFDFGVVEFPNSNALMRCVR